MRRNWPFFKDSDWLILASSTVDSHRAEVGSREFGSLKQMIPKLGANFEDFIVERHFEVFTFMVGYISSFLAMHDMMIGDVSKDTQHFLSGVFSGEYSKTARVAWTCLTESVVNRDLLGRVFATNSPSAGWRMLCE